MMRKDIRLGRLVGQWTIFVLLVSLLSASAHAQGFSYADFTSTAGLNLVRNAARAGNLLRLTPAAFVQGGAAWYAAKQPVANGFETTFQFRFTNPGWIWSNLPNPVGADGIAFVIQNSSTTELGQLGDGLGYHNIANSLAVELDCWRNDYYGDPNDGGSAATYGNHISVHTRGALPNSADEQYSVGRTSSIPNMHDGAVHSVTISYVPGTMTIQMDGRQVLTVSIDLSTKLSLDGGKAWVGFTAATGNAWQNQDILNWAYHPVLAVSADKLELIDTLGHRVQGIVCDNLRWPEAKSPDDPKEKYNKLWIDAPDYPGAEFSSNVTLSGTSPGCAQLTTDRKHVVYYPPDEFNTNPEPQSVNDIDKAATRTVSLTVHFQQGGNRYVVTKPIILARPPVVLVHGINSDPGKWNDLISGITGMDCNGNEGSAAGQEAPLAETPFVAVNHSAPITFPGGLDRGNAPVEIGAMLLAERISNVLGSVSRGEPITDSDENYSWSADPGDPWNHAYGGYRNKPLAIRRVDVVAWSYGGLVTRWYMNRTKPSISSGWYLQSFRYERNLHGVTATYNQGNLPYVPYREDVRKVITLGSMWRGVPLVNYRNEALFGGTGFGQASTFVLLIQGTVLGWLTRLDGCGIFRALVPSFEVMAVESNWMRQLVYGNTLEPAAAERLTALPFDDDVAYGSICGNKQAYPIAPLVRTNIYSDLSAAQSPSWFPYLLLEERSSPVDGYSDGLVPLWSSAIPGSYVKTAVSHDAYASDGPTQNTVVRWLNSSALPLGRQLTAIWNDPTSWDASDTAVRTDDGSKRWRYVPGHMAPYPQDEIYAQVGGEGRITPEVLASRGWFYPDILAKSLALTARLQRANDNSVTVSIIASNLWLDAPANVPIYDLTISGVSLAPIPGSFINLDPTVVHVGTLPIGQTRLIQVRFANMPNKSGQVYSVRFSYSYATSNGSYQTGLRLKVP